MGKEKLIKIGIIVAVVLIIAGIFISGYNNLVTLEEKVTTEASNLDVALQRRADLIPNLVSTVKGYAKHETEVIQKVTDARTKLINSDNLSDKVAANDELSKSLSALLVVVENYPDLKSSQNFIQLSDELAGTENRIAVARRDYNDKANEYNTSIKKFPSNIMAKLFGFDAKDYFKADETSKDAPQVSFDE